MTTAPLVSCAGKHPFPSMPAARRAARNLNRNHDDGHVGPYKCKACSAWHVGNTTPPPPRRKESRKCQQPNDASNSAD